MDLHSCMGVTIKRSEDVYSAARFPIISKHTYGPVKMRTYIQNIFVTGDDIIIIARVNVRRSLIISQVPS